MRPSHLEDLNGKADGEERIFEDMDWRILNVIEGPDGYIYFSTDSGSLYLIKEVIKE